MKMLMILEITNAVRNEFPMPWFKNYDKTIINSKHLSSRNSDMGKTFFLSEDIDNEDYDENGNELRDLNRSARDSMREYKNLCETVTRRVEFDDSVFEYQPPHYYEIFCKSHASDEENLNSIEISPQKCAHPGFDCVQRSRTLFMVRRKWEKDCWEPLTREIASGCDCMWPVSSLGDISIHY